MQSWWQRLIGWIRILFDIALQRVLNWNAASSHVLFQTLKQNRERSSAVSARPLAGKCAIVTGANTGLGLETARWLASNGATVVLACRSFEKASAAVADIVKSVPGALVEPAILNLSDLGSVREFAAKFKEKKTGDVDIVRPLHMLILNAGVMMVQKADPETHFIVNHVAHSLLALLLLPSLAAAASEHARVVFVSSIASLVSYLDFDDLHFRRRRYHSFYAYANSKMCNVLFAQALTSRLQGTKIICNAVHPGESTTDVSRYLGRVWMTLHKRIGSLFLLNPSEAARSTVYAAAAPEAAESPGAVFHVVNQILNIPGHLLTQTDEDKLWSITLQAAEVTSDDLKAARIAGLVDPPRRSSKHD